MDFWWPFILAYAGHLPVSYSRAADVFSKGQKFDAKGGRLEREIAITLWGKLLVSEIYSPGIDQLNATAHQRCLIFISYRCHHPLNYLGVRYQSQLLTFSTDLMEAPALL